MIDDAELLRRFAREGAEEAFGEIVRRYVDLVYSAALRQVGGDAHHAKDVAQLVFTDLARKAESVARRPVLVGWLFTATRFAAAKIVRGAQRRQTREQQVVMMSGALGENDAGEVQAEWERLRPVIDEAMGALKAVDREAVLLRFFENRGLAEVGARLGLSENAARMRVERALEKLRVVLARRGMTSTSAALGVVMANQAVVAAPVTLAAAVSGAAIMGATAVAAGGGAIFSLMALVHAKVAAGVIFVGLVAGIGWQQYENQGLRAANERAARDVGFLSADVSANREATATGENALRAFKERSQREAQLLAGVSPDAVFVDPKYLSDFAPQQRKSVGSPRLFRRLQLSPPEVERLIDLLVERHIAINLASDLAQKLARASRPGNAFTVEFDGNAEFNKRVALIGSTDVDRRIREFLGEERFAIYQGGTDGSHGRWLAEKFVDAAALRGVAVTDGQLDALKDVFSRESGGAHYYDEENQVHVLSEKVVSGSAAVLNPEQLAELERFRAWQTAEQQLKELNRVAAGDGLLKLKPSVAARYRPAKAGNEKSKESARP